MGYRELLEDLTARVRSTQVRAARAANTEVIALYWSIGREMLARLDEPAERDWYARQTLEHGWSRAVTEHQIMNGLRQRAGTAPSDFAAHLPAPHTSSTTSR